MTEVLTQALTRIKISHATNIIMKPYQLPFRCFIDTLFVQLNFCYSMVVTVKCNQNSKNSIQEYPEISTSKRSGR